ncbi:MAG: RNA 2',3'-cyclic phosphodiesterase [Desulfobacula sp.]|jgi:2'-5' RNA ligase
MTGNRQHIRSFIAIKLPDFIKLSLQVLQVKLSKSGIKASFPNPETLHLTLKFLGDILPGELDAVEKCMEKAVAEINPHTLFASGIGVFPSVKHTRVIWSGIRGETDILEKLVDELDAFLLKDMGIKREEKRFSPHLTLARIKERIPQDFIIKTIKDFENFCTPGFSVIGISLFQSKLISSGAVHREITFTPFPH